MIGCGSVSEPYVRNLTASALVEVVACADAIPERAAGRAATFEIARACSPDELLADPAIDLVVNLTVPGAHFPVTMAALRAGKHVWTEKPLSVDRKQAAAILAEAAGRELQVGCAPDTVLGAGLQTSRRLIEEGAIGEPLACAAFFMTRGPESWRPDPVFLYQPGAGQLRTTVAGEIASVAALLRLLGILAYIAVTLLLFDVGVYSVAALVNLLGPVSSVSAFGRVLYPERVIGSGPRVIEMAEAVCAGRAPRVSAAIGYHVFDVIQSVAEPAAVGRHVEVESTCAFPSPLPPDVDGAETAG